MRAVIQRVTSASVTIDGSVQGHIGQGFLILFGAGQGDTPEDAVLLARKTAGLRLFCDGDGKMNLSLKDVGGSVLVVSQFTLYGDCRRGNRPSFTGAALPNEAEALYEYFVALLRQEHQIADVQTGRFGADMKVALLNDGPVTILLDSADWNRPRHTSSQLGDNSSKGDSVK
ncbi:MAG: D-tyrosyl-tRNA(Tyr) deacylase [Clostridia bacterium]|nr:D-tyrosyl-tRNA(Tyr) deacylase [Clostridia bacterium]MBQ4395926.1 D-tyrosyl-tRNA(Tyr) deacylase [Clostridia bacterium]